MKDSPVTSDSAIVSSLIHRQRSCGQRIPHPLDRAHPKSGTDLPVPVVSEQNVTIGKEREMTHREHVTQFTGKRDYPGCPDGGDFTPIPGSPEDIYVLTQGVFHGRDFQDRCYLAFLGGSSDGACKSPPHLHCPCRDLHGSYRGSCCGCSRQGRLARFQLGVVTFPGLLRGRIADVSGGGRT